VNLWTGYPSDEPRRWLMHTDEGVLYSVINTYHPLHQTHWAVWAHRPDQPSSLIGRTVDWAEAIALAEQHLGPARLLVLAMKKEKTL